MNESPYMARKRQEIEPLWRELEELNGLDELTDEQKADHARIYAEVQTKKREFDAAAERYQQTAQIGTMVDALSTPTPGPRAVYERPSTGSKPAEPEVKALMEYIRDSREYKTVSNRPYDIMEKVPVRALLTSMERKTPYIPANQNLSNGAQIFGPNTPRISHPFLEMLRTVPWNELSVPYLAPVFDSHAAEVNIGSAKPESFNTGDFQNVMMRTIAHWKEVPRQIFRYFPAMQGVVEDELIGGVQAKAEDAILNGTGAGGNMKGILANVTQVGAGADMVVAILNGLGIIGAQGGTPDAIVMNPSDYWALVASGYTANKYNPIAGAGRIQGVQTVLTPAIAAGTTLVGDFSRAVTLYVGEAANVRATEALGFKNNIVTTLAELDCVVVVEYPKFLVKTTAPLP